MNKSYLLWVNSGFGRKEEDVLCGLFTQPKLAISHSRLKEIDLDSTYYIQIWETNTGHYLGSITRFVEEIVDTESHMATWIYDDSAEIVDSYVITR